MWHCLFHLAPPVSSPCLDGDSWLHPPSSILSAPKTLPNHQPISFLLTLRTINIYSEQKDYFTAFYGHFRKLVFSFFIFLIWLCLVFMCEIIVWYWRISSFASQNSFQIANLILGVIHDKYSGPCVKLSSVGFALRTMSPLAVEAGV